LRQIGPRNERAGGAWFFRIASLAALIGVIAAIVFFIRRGNLGAASLLLFLSPAVAVALSWNWTGSLFAPFEWAKRYVDGVEGEHRHEWYAFKGHRIRVMLDEDGAPWFSVKEIAFVLAIKVDKQTFRHYGPHEYGIPESASESYLSEAGLRRMIKYSSHPDAGALGIWLEREVVRVLTRQTEMQATARPKPDK
jgi:hypothetical protein